MRQIRDCSDSRNKSWCIHCGESALICELHPRPCSKLRESYCFHTQKTYKSYKYAKDAILVFPRMKSTLLPGLRLRLAVRLHQIQFASPKQQKY